MKPTVYWIASLSNGEMATEGKGKYTEATGDLSPYQRLLAFCRESGVSITSLALATADGRRWNLPSSGSNPKFKAFADAPRPSRYNFFRKMGGDVRADGSVENQECYHCIEAVFQGGMRIQVWVAENGQSSWSFIL